MLLELTITDFAIIERLRFRLSEHFTVLTGETGAGKSIIIDAMSALVGERLGADAVRAGADRAIVEGLFDVSAVLTARDSILAAEEDHVHSEHDLSSDSNDTPTLGDMLRELGLDAEDGQLILTREINLSGRSTARINGRVVTLSALQQLASELVDIHGQGAHLSLLRQERHVDYLDRFAGTLELRAHVAQLVTQWRATKRDLDALQRDERELERRTELLRFQVAEIEGARLESGEQELLERERRMLANAERLGELSTIVHEALLGEESGEGLAALDLLASARRALDDLLRLDPSLQELAASLDESVFRLEDVAAGVRSYQVELAVDPERLAAVEERLDLIARLRRKYGATVAEILVYGAQAADELERLGTREERVAELQRREAELRRDIGTVAVRLSRVRRQAASELSREMERQLDDLKMKRARFQVDLRQQPDPDGALSDPTGNGSVGTYAFDSSGIDRVEFLIAPNQGEPFKPLVRIASGGETSRMMLALKTILANANSVPVLIFDEIDTGISGRAGQVVGEKLWELARTHQVICVTHLAQIAALADEHVRVTKQVERDRTTTAVGALSGDERIAEIGQMLGGSATRAARENASDLLARGSEWKSGSVAAAEA
jgi:DNA repair protein RecN (Recombination protein N)